MMVGMYLRTTKRRNRDGSVVTYLQLAHNQRDPETGVVSAQVIHTFGREDQVDREQLVRLCRSIGRVCGVEVIDRQAGQQDDRPGGGPSALAPGVVQHGTRAFGAVLALDALWERHGIGPVLREATKTCTVPYERALFAMTANRLCDPESKLGVWGRWLDAVHLPSCDTLKLPHMYEAMDHLHAHAAAVEEAVFFRTADLLSLEVDVVFYDTTTCSFAIDEADDEDEGGLRRFGHSKEGTWTPQVVIALAVTREGLPVRSWVFPGNKADVKTVEQVKKDLRGWKLGRALFVADSGMNSDDNRLELLQGCGRYLLAARVGSVKEVKAEVLSRAGRYKVIDDNLHAKEVTVGEGELRRRYVVCFNPKEAERQARHREAVLEELVTELAAHPDRTASAKWAIELQASGRYGRYVMTDPKGKLVIDRAAAREAARLDGKWVLLTNDDTLTVEDAATAYKSLLIIERCFRSLKRTQIEMAPMYHWVPRRIETHVKICVLALLLERVAERATGSTWAFIRRTLDRLQVTEFESESYRFFQTNEPRAETLAVMKKLDVPRPKRILAVQATA